MARLTLDIRATDNASQILAKVNDAKKKLNREGEEGRKTTDRAASSANRAGASYEMMAGKIAAAGAAIMQVGAFFVQATAAADAQIKAEARLAGVIRATGQSASFSVGRLNEFAGAMQAATNIDDIAILSAISQFVSLGNVSEETAMRAAKAAGDMGAVFGDMNSASLALGRALGSPTEGMGALQRAGVRFSEEQKNQIEYLVEQNRLFDAQVLILEEVEARFGGTAGKIAENVSGMARLQNAWGDFLEAFGRSPVVEATLGNLTQGATALLEAFSGAAAGARATQEINRILRESTKLVQIGDGGGVTPVAGLESQAQGLARALAAVGPEQVERYMREMQQARNRLGEQMVAAQREMQRLANDPAAREFHRQRIDQIRGQIRDYSRTMDVLRHLAEEGRRVVPTQTPPTPPSRRAAEPDRAAERRAEREARDKEEKARAEAAMRERIRLREEEAVREFATMDRRDDEMLAHEADRAKAVLEFREAANAELLRNQEEALAREQEMQRAHVGALRQIYSQGLDVINALFVDSLDQRINELTRKLRDEEKAHSAQLQLKKDLGVETAQFEQDYANQQLLQEEELERLRTEKARRVFERDKLLGIADATMKGAQGVAAVLAMGPVGIALAGVIAALTAAQIAIIAGQEFPGLATGGIVEPRPGGSLFRLAEAGVPEAVIPLPKLGQLGGITINIGTVVGVPTRELVLTLKREMKKLELERAT